jgi:hypothetical protein
VPERSGRLAKLVLFLGVIAFLHRLPMASRPLPLRHLPLFP